MSTFYCPLCAHVARSESGWDDHRRSAHPKPRRDFTGPLAPYLTHASAFGVELVFETALADAAGLAPDPRARVKVLALLAKRLRELDKRWRSPIGLDRAVLLHDQGHDLQTIGDLLGMSRQTVRKRIRDVLEGGGGAETAPSEPANAELFSVFSSTEGDCLGASENEPSGALEEVAV